MENVITGSEILLESLKREKVDVMFGLPGGAVLPLYDALYSAGIRHLLVRHEQAAAFAADGYARVTGKPGVCLVTSGPGATNLMTGLTSALMDSIPVVALTGQVPQALIGKDGFQEADTIGISLPCTKHSFQIRTAAEIPAVIHRAFETALGGRPGPVLVDLPKSALIEKAVPTYIEGGSRQPVRKREWRNDQIDRAVGMVFASLQPVLYVGGGAIHAGAWPELAEFAELTQIPVTTTLMGLGAFPSSHPLSMGMLGMHGSYSTNMATCECDLLIAVGARFDDRVTGRLKDFATKARKIQIDVDPSEIGKNVPVDIGLVGDARETLRALIDAVKRRQTASSLSARRTWLDRIDAWRREHPLDYDKSAESIKPEYVIEMISRYANEDAIVSVDVGQHQMWAAQYYDFYQPRTWLSSSGLGAMGYGFPAAMGAQLAFPDRQVVAIVGDGGFQMTLNDLATVAQYRVPVKIAILNNRALGMVRQWQEIFFEKRYCDIDLNFAPDFAKLAESYGLRGSKVEHHEDVKDAVREMLSDREPCLVDFWVDPAENVYPIVPPGASLAEMIVEPPRVQLEEEQVLDDLWAV
ncbi:MAG TPA: biosynthetic-type acetolactate synthase large subunit [Terriglobia bacterium]|nr:biosynthetic-type acetolactate synthase large subunit [Terriglobia bacterium]